MPAEAMPRTPPDPAPKPRGAPQRMTKFLLISMSSRPSRDRAVAVAASMFPRGRPAEERRDAGGLPDTGAAPESPVSAAVGLANPSFGSPPPRVWVVLGSGWLNRRHRAHHLRRRAVLGRWCCPARNILAGLECRRATPLPRTVTGPTRLADRRFNCASGPSSPSPDIVHPAPPPARDDPGTPGLAPAACR